MEVSSAADEERAMEVEALLAIYEDELRMIPDENDEKTVSFEIELKDICAVLTIIVSDEYPNCAPRISVQKCGKNLAEVENFLKITSKKLCGEVMVHSLIGEANKWAREMKLQKRDLNKEETAASVCKFFLEGRCRFRDRCINSHQLARKKTDEETPECENKDQEKLVRESENNKVSKHLINSGNDKEERPTKKAPMKTATDVISRILWDDKLDPKDFAIGYLDRFIGIMERKFTDFSWEDIASVDYDVLSIPKHRIQYFKYNGDIVWDKRERIDKIFGSTGSGCTILEVLENGNKGEEREEGSEERKVNEDKDEIIACESVIISSSTRNDSGPNYFIAFKVQDPGVLEKVGELHKELLLREKCMSEGIISPQNLHVTLLVLTIRNDDQLNLVKDALKGLHHVLPSILPLSRKLKFKAIGSFNDRVLYVRVEKEPSFEKFVEILRRQLRNVGANLDGNRETFSPHMTVVRAPTTSKMSRATSREVFSSFESAYKDVEFGNQGISEIGLFSRFDPKESDGFHKTVLTIKNSLLSVLPTLEKKIVKYVEDLYDSEKISVELKKKVNACAESKVPIEIDEVFSALEAAVPKNPRKLVVILRGIPGSGKTYLVENSSENNTLPYLNICNPKQLFYRAGNSKMNQSELNIAEAYCRNGFLEALNSAASLVVVDDCHSQTWQYAFYIKLACLFGFTVRVLEIQVSDRDGILECLKHRGSESSMNEVLDMVRYWEEDPRSLLIKPWFRNPSLQESVALRNLIESSQ